MDPLIILGLVLFAAILLKMVVSNANHKRKVFKNGVYQYTAKPSLMSPSEDEFFWTLYRVAQDRYFIFPQVHLSSLLDHRVKGQAWGYAFRHINGKSVDYVLCDKETLRPVYAVELDDPTHDRPDRIKRDIEVERIFEEADIPLVRFRNYRKLSDGDIINTFANARKLKDTQG